MALTRPGAAAPTLSVPNAQAVANRSLQSASRAGSTALQAASPSVPVEITGADGQHFTVSFADIRNFIEPKATDAECKIFLETCKQYHLNPFTKEAYLIHYDNKNESAASTIVLGKNCYLQMAERHPAYDGFEAGVIVLTADGQLLNREGSIVYDGDGGETLLGGWAKVYRKDRTRASYEEVKLTEYDTGKSLWNGKKATMIRKVALVHALREAFPSTFGALYDESEVSVHVDAESTAREIDPEDLPVLDPYAGTKRPRKTAGTLPPAPEEPAVEDDPFRGDDA
jgi:phage recombination protein Bet|nr:MAG TPA: RecT protein [Caudoviricetes sp.]